MYTIFGFTDEDVLNAILIKSHTLYVEVESKEIFSYYKYHDLYNLKNILNFLVPPLSVDLGDLLMTKYVLVCFEYVAYTLCNLAISYQDWKDLYATKILTLRLGIHLSSRFDPLYNSKNIIVNILYMFPRAIPGVDYYAITHLMLAVSYR